MINNKRIVTLSFLLILISLVSNAQPTGYHKGYLVTKSYDTIPGYVKHINNVPYKILIKVRYKENLDDQPVGFTPKEILGFRIANEFYISMPSDVRGTTRRFLNEVIRGKLSLYRQHIVFGHGQVGQAFFLLKEGKKRLQIVPDLGFRKSISKYLSDNAALAQKILDKEYRYGDLEQIVAEYNRAFKKANQDVEVQSSDENGF